MCGLYRLALSHTFSSFKTRNGKVEGCFYSQLLMILLQVNSHAMLFRMIDFFEEVSIFIFLA